jgi:hypothetical protein
MSQENGGPKRAPGAAFQSILWGGFTAGTLDIAAAALINFVRPVVVLHSIASGLLGKASFSAGASSALLGLLLQWAISLVIASVYTLAAMRWSILTRRWVAGGLAHGVGIFTVMNYIVVPLSAAWRTPLTWKNLLHRFTPEKFATNLLALLLFGLIVAFFANHFLGGRMPNAGPGHRDRSLERP